MCAEDELVTQNGEFLLQLHEHGGSVNGITLAWPIVSTMTQSYATPLCSTFLGKVSVL